MSHTDTSHGLRRDTGEADRGRPAPLLLPRPLPLRPLALPPRLDDEDGSGLQSAGSAADAPPSSVPAAAAARRDRLRSISASERAARPVRLPRAPPMRGG